MKHVIEELHGSREASNRHVLECMLGRGGVEDAGGESEPVRIWRVQVGGDLCRYVLIQWGRAHRGGQDQSYQAARVSEVTMLDNGSNPYRAVKTTANIDSGDEIRQRTTRRDLG